MHRLRPEGKEFLQHINPQVSLEDCCIRVIDAFGAFAWVIRNQKQHLFEVHTAAKEMRACLFRYRDATLAAFDRHPDLLWANSASMWQIADSREWLGSCEFASATILGEKSNGEQKLVQYTGSYLFISVYVIDRVCVFCGTGSTQTFITVIGT